MLRIRTHEDGSLWIPRPDPETEAYLDQRYHRAKPPELRWIVRAEDHGDFTDVAAGMHAGRRAIVFGKGPSFDFWTLPREDEIRVGLNEATLLVPDCDFAFFVDARIGGALSGRLPITTIPVRPVNVARYPLLSPGHWSMLWRWTETQERHGVPSSFATAAACVQVLGCWGIREILFVGFDGYDGDHAPSGTGVYARGLDEVLVVGRENAAFDLINRQIDQAIAFWGIRIAWFHRREGWNALKGPERPCAASEGSEA